MTTAYAPAPDGAPPMDDIAPPVMARLRTGAWLDEQVFPPLSWAVPGLIPEGMVLLTGPPKAGKSWAALGVSLAVATGGVAFGRVPVGPPRPVLLLALEDGDRRIQGRCRSLLQGDPIPGRLHYLTRATPAEVLDVIEEWLRIHGAERPLVVLDTLGRVQPASLPGESAYQRDYRIGARLKALVDAYPGSTLLVVHHVRKAVAAEADWMDGTSGTNGLNGAADATINLHRPRGEDAGLLRVTGRDVVEAEYAVTTSSGSWTIDGATLDDAARAAATRKATADLGDRSAEVVQLVTSLGQAKASDVEAALDMPDARRYLARLADTGRLVRAARGLYTPVPTVPSVPSEDPVDAPPLSHVGVDGTTGRMGQGYVGGHGAR